MPATLILLLGWTIQQSVDLDQRPLALHRSMELDDQDREIRRQHDLVLSKKAELARTTRLAERGLISRDEYQRTVTDVRIQEAREAEMIAYRALKAYERDVLRGAVAHDDTVAYKLLLDLLARQEAMARVDQEYRGYRLRQEQTLLERNATSRLQRDLAQLDYEAAKGNVAISIARQAQVAMDLAAKAGIRPADAEEHGKRRKAYIEARIRYSETRVAGIRLRLDVARQGVQAGISREEEVAAFQQMLDEAQKDLDAEKALLDDPDKPLPPSATRFT